MGTGCEIGVGFVVTPDNWREVYQGVELARRLGADNIRISAQFSTADEKLFAEFHEECSALCREAEGLAGPSFRVHNRFGEKLADLRSHRPDYAHCGYQQFTTYIGADLNVYRCCVTSYNERGLVGSLKEQRFKDLWLSQERAKEMLAFDARGCDRCQFNIINRNINYLSQGTPPKHSEFV
jgi:MoaA/NifB/PqqE/SkfB family radical SAM enzyme